MAEDEYSLSEFDDDNEEVNSDLDSEDGDLTPLGSSTNIRIEKENTSNFEGEEDLAGIEESDYQTKPEIILAKLRREDDNYLGFFDLRINRIKCLALCKIVFGENHWKTAEAHTQLAETYLKGKFYLQQTLKHANLAKIILLKTQSCGDTIPVLELQYLLMTMYLILGRANYKLNKFKVSENGLRKAKLVSDNSNSTSSKFLSIRISILSALGDTICKLGNYGQSIECIEEGLDIVQKMPDSYSYFYVNLYRQLVETELMNEKHANFDLAIDSAVKAREVSENINGSECKETAEIFTLISKVESMKEVSNYESVEENIKKAIEIYVKIEMPDKELLASKMYCKALMQQDKLGDAKSVLQETIRKCDDIFGDCSIQIAELFELMGSILFAERNQNSALTYFTKAQDIYNGKRKCANKRQRLDQIIDMIRKSSKDELLKTSDEKLKERPRFA